MQCYVYRSPRRADTYLFLPRRGDFSAVPQALIRLFGTPEFALEFELRLDRKLAAADAKLVLEQLREQGFYLQMPSENEVPI